jgi:hypothetical protein
MSTRTARPVDRAQAQRIAGDVFDAVLPDEEELARIAVEGDRSMQWDDQFRYYLVFRHTRSRPAPLQPISIVAHSWRRAQGDGHPYVTGLNRDGRWVYALSIKTRIINDDLNPELSEVIDRDEAERLSMDLFGVSLPAEQELLRIAMDGWSRDPLRGRGQGSGQAG